MAIKIKIKKNQLKNNVKLKTNFFIQVSQSSKKILKKKKQKKIRCLCLCLKLTTEKKTKI